MIKRLYIVLILLVSLVVYSQDSVVDPVALSFNDDSITDVSRVLTFYLRYEGSDTVLRDFQFNLEPAVERDLWSYRGDFVRTNSSLGGLGYSSLEPWSMPNERGWTSFLARQSRHALRFNAKAPVSVQHYQSGLGGGQRYGMEVLTPVSYRSQLHFDYWRTNVAGFYRGEGADGHDLVFDYVQSDSITLKERWSLKGGYFSVRNGENGGLRDAFYFEDNYPGIRGNLSVVHPNGYLAEKEFNVVGTYWLHETGIALLGQYRNSIWASGNDFGQREYFWDSTGVDPELDSRYLFYEDSTGLAELLIGAKWSEKLLGFDVEVQVDGGLERFYSDVSGWDGFRVDSIHPYASFSHQLSPVLKGHFSASRVDELAFGRSSFRVDGHTRFLGWNTGATDLSGTWKLERGMHALYAEGQLRGGTYMHRWEGLKGYSYDLPDTLGLWSYSRVEGGWEHGRNWFQKISLSSHAFTGYRYFEQASGNAPLLWNGVFGRLMLETGRRGDGFNFRVKGYVQEKSAMGGMAMPNWGALGTLSYRGVVGPRFDWHAGLRVEIENRVYLPSYEVGLPVWHLQDDVEAGVYPWATVFANARLGSFVLGAEIINVAQGLAPYEYWAYGTVARPDRWIRLSARWTLFN